MAEVPVARSPIAPAAPVKVEHGWEISARRTSASLRIMDCTPLTKVLVRASADGAVADMLAAPFGRAARDEHETLVVGSGPGEWLLLASPGAAEVVIRRVEEVPDENLVSVFDATHGRALMRITGARVADLLAKVCGVDLSEEVTPDGAAFRSSVAKLVTDVVRDDQDGVLSYLLHCERSSGQYLFDALIDAGDEFGIEVEGFVAPEMLGVFRMIHPTEMPNDLQIARKAKLKPLSEVAASMGIGHHLLEPYGSAVAKVKLEAIEELSERPPAKYVVVSAITPTPLGEGKTTTTVGLGQAFSHIGKKATVAIRQPAMGPTFGIKGGAAGGGYSQVVPMEMLNLHLTGDTHAVTAAHNLLSAMLDNHIHQNDDFFHIDRHSVTWRRVLDVNDRSLRNVIIGLGPRADGVIRESGFDITAASEVMAILALSTSLKDLRRRLGRIVVGSTTEGEPVTAEDLHAAGAMAVIMREAIKPNLMQTLERTPVLVHAGPFGNIATGNSSIVADLIGIRSGEFLITEAGFGADMGAERFFNIKCRYSGLKADAAVLVATVRALKAHSRRFKIVAGKPLPEELLAENPEDVLAGAENLRKQIENIRVHGVSPVVAINAFPTDHPSEHAAIREVAEGMGAHVAVCNHFSEGGAGAVELAEAVCEAAQERTSFRFLYKEEAPLREKIETIAKKVYGADGVEYDMKASQQLDSYEKMGFGHLPVCIAKTHLSISSDPTLMGAPKGWVLPVREVRASVGAGFIYPICGEMRTMPGLSRHPAAERIDIDENGEIVGLS